MKTLFAFAALVSSLAIPAGAHTGHDYGVFWKNGRLAEANGGQALPEDIWRYAFVSKFRW